MHRIHRFARAGRTLAALAAAGLLLGLAGPASAGPAHRAGDGLARHARDEVHRHHEAHRGPIHLRHEAHRAPIHLRREAHRAPTHLRHEAHRAGHGGCDAADGRHGVAHRWHPSAHDRPGHARFGSGHRPHVDAHRHPAPAAAAWLCAPCGHRFGSAAHLHRHLHAHHGVPWAWIQRVVHRHGAGGTFRG